jgi:acyl dehydratase
MSTAAVDFTEVSAVVYGNATELIASRGVELGPTDWLIVEQDRITGFGTFTDDMQWIHTDPVRAAGGPYRGTIAHGFLTLSLIPSLTAQLRVIEGTRLRINYGLDKVRFPTPVPVGGRIRARATLLEAEQLSDGALHMVTRVSVELEGAAKPACIADVVGRCYFEGEGS